MTKRMKQPTKDELRARIKELEEQLAESWLDKALHWVVNKTPAHRGSKSNH